MKDVGDGGRLRRRYMDVLREDMRLVGVGGEDVQDKSQA